MKIRTLIKSTKNKDKKEIILEKKDTFVEGINQTTKYNLQKL